MKKHIWPASCSGWTGLLATVAVLTFAAGPGYAAGENMRENMQQSPQATGQTMPVKHDAALDSKVMQTLQRCKDVSTSCKTSTQSAAGVLVFPSVIKADLIVGGAGGRGALVQNGQITGYYNIGVGTAGLEAGVEDNSQVYVFPTEAALSDLQSSSDWKVGTSAGVTLITADAETTAATGNVLAYVFNAKGLHGDLSLDAFYIWKTGQTRPSPGKVGMK